MLFRMLYEAVSTRSVEKVSQNKDASTVIFRQTVAQPEAWSMRAEEVLAYFRVYDHRGTCTQQTDSSLTIQ